MVEKFCKDCKHCNPTKWRCTHPYAKARTDDYLVTGEEVYQQPCRDMRAGKSSWICGPKGSLWEPKR